MKNIILIGMPGCGKTTIGKRLAKVLEFEFIDCDRVIEESEGILVSNIFAKYGEGYFRSLETKTLERLSSTKNAVIATGGGCVERRENFEILRKSGTVVFINRPLESILGDIDISKRPLLADGKERLFELSKRRIPLYKEVCDIEISNTERPAVLIQKIIDEVKKNG